MRHIYDIEEETLLDKYDPREEEYDEEEEYEEFYNRYRKPEIEDEESLPSSL